MASHDELYNRVYDQMINEQGEATETEAWNETIRILKGVAEGTVTLRELDAQYGIIPEEFEGYDPSDLPSEAPEIEDDALETATFDPAEELYEGQESSVESPPTPGSATEKRRTVKEPKRTGRESLERQADRLLE